MAVEEPKYEIVVQDAGFEVRRYAPFIVAETWVDGDMDAASGKGFRAIADYIFGNNKSPQSAASSKIAMTAPVVMQPAREADGMVGAQRWRVHFVMPSEYTLASLPTPTNGAVTLREVPATLVAVAKYSGFNTERRIHEETLALAAWMETRKLAAVGTAKLARYDPPWTLPMWRRNEIHMEMLPSTAR
ncbi:MAG: heme-binding protein [Rhodoferax sp.]|nr:heme-binding protein [Rhodoferax sp.]